MKTILLILAIIGFTMNGTYAQSKNCACKRVHHKTVKKTSIHKSRYASRPITESGAMTYTLNQRIEPCTRYRKHNILVTECPGTFYDNSDVEAFEAQHTYMGNYPAQTKTTTPQPMAPQHTTIDNYQGVAPANGNACSGNCSSY
jgi:hypothetical protein